METEDALVALAGATNWHKSSYSKENGGCVEVGSVELNDDTNARLVGVRDSKQIDSPVLPFTGATWMAFITANA
jgi:hypothetical protein